jgi:hypothetical protein
MILELRKKRLGLSSSRLRFESLDKPLVEVSASVDHGIFF